MEEEEEEEEEEEKKKKKKKINTTVQYNSSIQQFNTTVRIRMYNE